MPDGGTQPEFWQAGTSGTGGGVGEGAGVYAIGRAGDVDFVRAALVVDAAKRRIAFAAEPDAAGVLSSSSQVWRSESTARGAAADAAMDC